MRETLRKADFHIRVVAFLSTLILFVIGPYYIREYWYDYGPIDWFVKIDRVEVHQEDREAILYTVFRDVKFEMRGRFNRELFCARPVSLIFTYSKEITFNKTDENQVELRIPIDDRFKGCEEFFYEVHYFAIMPNGTERHLPTQRSNNFTIDPGNTDYQPFTGTRQFQPPMRTIQTRPDKIEVKVENNTTNEAPKTETPKESTPAKDALEDLKKSLEIPKIPEVPKAPTL